MSKASRNVILLAKIQSVAGTDSVPTVGANAILCSEPKVDPLNAQIVKRNNVLAWMGNPGSVVAAVHSTIEFEVEMQGSGVAGTPPKFGPLLRACALGETIVAATSVDYAPVDTAHELLSFYYFLDGIKHVITDAKGTVSFDLNAQGIPVMKFKFWGFYSTPTDLTNPSGTDYSGFKDPLPINKANTTAFTLHGIALKSKSQTLDLANQVEYVNKPNFEGIQITNRMPVGSAVFEVDTLAVKDWYSVIKNGTLGALAVTHGLTAGYVSGISAPKVQLTNLSYTSDQGIAHCNSSMDLQANAGRDELVVTFT